MNVEAREAAANEGLARTTARTITCSRKGDDLRRRNRKSDRESDREDTT